MKRIFLFFAAGFCFSLFAEPTAKECADLANAALQKKNFAEAAVYYGKAADISSTNALQRSRYLVEQFSAFDRAGDQARALDAAIESFTLMPTNNLHLQNLMKSFSVRLVQKRNYSLVSNLLSAVKSTKNIDPNFIYLGNDAYARLLIATENFSAAREQLGKMLDDEAHFVDTISLLRSTYKGREEQKGFALARNEFRKHPNLSAKDKIRFWNDYGFQSHLALSLDGMKLATRELALLGETNGVSLYKGRVQRALEAFENLETFPRQEAEIIFPDSIKDFGDPMTNATVYVAKDFGFDPTNATEFLQKALDSGASRVIVENVGKPWYIRRINVRSNTELIFQKGVRVHTDRTWNEFSKGGMFYLNDVKNVVIKGENPNDTEVVISQFYDLPDRARHCKTYGHSGIILSNVENVAIKNLRISDTAEDGIVFAGLGLSNKNVYIENVDLDSNYRQACSLCACHGAYFKNAKFRRTAGAEPLAGIDLEPAEYNEANSDIYLFDCEFDSNMGGGLLFSTSSYQPISLYAKRCVFKPQRRGDLLVFIRQGLYMGRNIKAPGKAVFEECDFRSFSDVSPITIEGCLLLDMEFKNCTITDCGKLLNRHNAADASAINFNLNNDVYYSYKIPDSNEQATLTFENVTITGFTNAPPVQFQDAAGHYSVRNLKGKVNFNGKSVDLASFRYEAPDNKYDDIPGELPAKMSAPSLEAPSEKVEHSFTFRYDAPWWAPRPDYTYLFYGKKGKSAEFLIRHVGGIYGDKTIAVKTPSGAIMNLGEFEKGDNSVKIDFPEDGLYSLHPAANHILVNYSGVNLCYFAGTGKDKKIQIDAPNGYVGYFELPAKKEVAFKVFGGTVEIRASDGELVTTLVGGGRKGSAIATLRTKSKKSEIWSFAIPEKATFKFFAPATGVWADSPLALPTLAAEPKLVRSPVIILERAEAADISAETTSAEISLADFLKANPVLEKIVEKEVASRLEWAKKGEYGVLFKEAKAALERLKENATTEQTQREITDLAKNLDLLEKLAAMEERVEKMPPEELRRYAFCNAFVVLLGVYPEKDVGNGFVRCLFEGSDMAADYPEVYWWIYKTTFEQFIAGRIGEYNLGYHDFTILCDNDEKLSKLLPILEKITSECVPEDLK